MKRSFLLAVAAIGLSNVGAEELAITNARIVDGTGSVINRGVVQISDGRIFSVSASNNGVIHMPIIDAEGMTLLPGFIDTHRHDLIASLAGPTSDAEMAQALENDTPENLRRLLEEGYTTIMLAAFDATTSIEARRRQRDGTLEGPRILTAGPAFTAPGDHPAGSICRGNTFCATHLAYEVDDPAIARALVRDLAHAGVDAIKAVVDRQIVPDIRLDEAVLAAIVEEAHFQGLPAFVHAETVEDMLTAARLGADRLVHTPNDALIADGNGADLLRRLDVAVATTVSFSSPQWDELSGTKHEDRRQRILRNVEHLWDNGVIVAFGTDSPPGIRPIVEIEQLATVLSPARVIMSLTRNAAVFLDLNDEIGTIEASKIADLVLVEGNPLSDIRTLANVKLVMQAGRIVVDKR